MSNPASISTLSEFLLQAQTQYIVFDLGRGIRKIDNQTFFEWENQQTPCQFPRQDNAWFCITFWNEKISDERYIWFIKLPLDEQGLMNSAALHQFLEIIVQALGKGLEHTENKKAQLPENPYVFIPSQQQLADCNAHIRKIFGTKPRDISKARAYMQAPLININNNAWSTLTLQDLADYVICDGGPIENLNESPLNIVSNQGIIAKNLSLYAREVLNCLFASLESIEVELPLVKALIDFHKSTDDPTLASLCLRAMSYKPHALSNEYLSQLIANNAKKNIDNSIIELDIETCVVISGRYWHLLKDTHLLLPFLHKVALLDPSFALFKGLYADLVKVPDTRKSLLSFIRHTERSTELSEAIGALFSS